MSVNKMRLEEVATDIVQRSGTAGISFRKLADEIGIKSSSVHHHYPEKSDLIQTIIASYSENFLAQLKEIENRRGKLQSKLTRFIDLFDQVADEEKFCLCGMMAAELGLLDQSSIQLLKKFFTDVEDWLESLLAAHRSELVCSNNTGVLAKNIISGLEGALLSDRVFGNKERIKSQRKRILTLIN